MQTRWLGQHTALEEALSQLSVPWLQRVQAGQDEQQCVGVVVGVDYPHCCPLNRLQHPGLCRRETWVPRQTRVLAPAVWLWCKNTAGRITRIGCRLSASAALGSRDTHNAAVTAVTKTDYSWKCPAIFFLKQFSFLFLLYSSQIIFIHIFSCSANYLCTFLFLCTEVNKFCFYSVSCLWKYCCNVFCIYLW